MYTVIPFISTVVNDNLNKSYSALQFGLGLDVGEANGYIAIDKTHPLYKMHYDEVNEYICAPGGFTYSEFADPRFLANCKNIPEEYDKDLTQLPTDMWILGWDSLHYGMNRENYSKEIVIGITKELAKEFSKFDSNLIKE